MSRSYTLGPTGIIPNDEYLRKIEENNIPEDPYAYEKYIRKQLVDYRPDDAFFESDQTRDPSDRGSGVGSTERINLRYEGTRTGISPDLPDGTFLDHEFTERDPRGTQNMPDFAAARNQREARGKFINFYNDNDYSVPETGINPVQMVSLVRGAQKQFKDRYRNFDESFDSWHNGSPAQRGNKSVVSMTTHDGTVMDLATVPYKHRIDPVNLLSNRVPGIPRWTEPDHRVKVSKFGQVRPVMDIGANSWNENRNNSYLDHAIPVEINGTMINRMLANMILDIEGQRMSKQAAAQGADYSESEIMQIRDARKVLNPDDVLKLIAIGLSSQTQMANAHTQFYGNEANNINKQHVLDVRNMLGETKINHDMAASMLQCNRVLGPKEQKDLRKSVIESGTHHRHMIRQNNEKNKANKVYNTLVRESMDTRHIEESRGIKLYSTIKPINNSYRLDDIACESYKRSSRTNENVNRRSAAGKNKTVDDIENDVDMSEFSLPGRKEQITSDPKKYKGRSIQSDYGDTQRDDSVSKIDMHDALSAMLMQE